MDIEVKQGQVWKTKDKRRSTQVEVVDKGLSDDHDPIVIALDLATQIERVLKIDTLTKRWDLVSQPTLVEDIEVAAAIENLDAELEKLLKPKHKTREAWLEAAVKLLTKALFDKVDDVTIPAVRVSVGWPGGRGPKGSVIGQCWKTETATDKVSQIFISPVVSEPVKALATLAHEMIHASDDGESGHRGHFKRTAKAIGFQGKMTLVDPSEELTDRLRPLAERLGTYPHAALNTLSKPKVQKTYMLKIGAPECGECDPEYKLRMTEKWVEDGGYPLCPHGIEMEEVD